MSLRLPHPEGRLTRCHGNAICRPGLGLLCRARPAATDRSQNLRFNPSETVGLVSTVEYHAEYGETHFPSIGPFSCIYLSFFDQQLCPSNTLHQQVPATTFQPPKPCHPRKPQG